MPPKKPGLVVEFIAEKYGNIPDAPPLRNGHVLHIFFQQKRKITHTIQQISKILGSNVVVKPWQINYLLKKTIRKYQHFTRESDKQHFQDVCDQVFTLHTLAQPSPHKAPSVSDESQLSHPSTSQFEVSSPAIMTLSPLTVSELTAGEESCTSSTQSPAVSVRTSPRIALTPEFQRIKRRLSFVMMTKSDMKNKYRDSVKSLREQLKSSHVQKVKYLNQDIKRKKKIIAKKNDMICLLRKEIKRGPDMEQLDLLRKRLSYEKKKNLQLKKYGKCKKVAETSASAESDDSRGLIAAKTVNVQSQRIRELENENLVLQEKVEVLTNRQRQVFVREGKIYPFDLRMVVYDHILNNVPTRSIPILIQKWAQRAGFTLDTVPHRGTVEQMVRELGVVSDFQVAEFLLSNQELTLGFDATTQEGVHVNEIHFTSASDCLIMSLDLLPGGTAEDYQLHIQESLNRVADVYTKIYDCNFENIRKTMIANIKNTLTDRSAVNHATISQLEEAWGVSFNELNCHLHPLETIARSCRSTLKDAETVRGSLSGNDCIAGNIVLAVNKFRYKDGKGDPRGFVSFLEKSGLPKGLLPRYRGNRLHVLFVICEQLMYHYDLFLNFFSTGTVSCSDLQSALLSDFGSATGKVEMQVLGLIGIFLSGPWMSKFYTAAATQTVSHVDGIETVRNVIETIKTYVEVPLETLVLKKDVFGGELQASSVQKLQMEPADRSLFATMMSACLAQIVVALERQYSRYFKLDINEVLRKETESARCHNIDAEAVMGMFSAAKSRAPNATLCFISSKIRAKKNRTCDYLDNLDAKKKNKLLNVSISLARQQRCVVRKKCFEIRDEIIRRIAVKTQKRASSDKNKLKTAPKNSKLDLSKDFPHIQYVSQLQRWRSGTGSEPKSVSPGLSTDVQGVLNTSLPALCSAIQRLKSAQENSDLNEIRRAVAEIYQLVEEAWVLPAVGRQVAEEICNRIRLDGGLELLLLQLQKTPEVEIIHESAKLLEQILTSENRDYVARLGLGVILNLARQQEDAQLARSVSGILQHMFKHTEETSVHLISNGALGALLFWCRGTDPTVLRHCAVALSNCAIYGGHRCQRLMIDKQAAEWLFPLAFSKQDELIRFHACLAVTMLAANREMEREVVKSGTLELVEPFIASLDLDDFACSLLNNTDCMQGKTASDLQHLLPLLDGTRVEGKCIAAFYICVEASIKSRQRNTKIFQEIGAVQSLKRIVMYCTNETACSLSKKALSMMGEEVPKRIFSSVSNWTTCEVRVWLQQVGFSAYCDRFQELQVDGDLLLNITDQDLSSDLGMTAGLTRKRFLRELRVLKTYADYSTSDPNNMSDWLAEVDPLFRQYTYGMVQSGVDRNNILNLNDHHLQYDCHIENGVHRAKILSASRKPSKPCHTDAQPPGPDVFISYRRTTGSQLASLLKVHLQVRGYSVFIDVEKLEAGKFEDKLVQSVQRAQHFILVLSANALDKCMGDTGMKDWVHKEIVTALACKKNIVPVVDNFVWPEPTSLPEDMRPVLNFNGIKWSHEYQKATVEKILRFLKEPQDQTDRANKSKEQEKK